MSAGPRASVAAASIDALRASASLSVAPTAASPATAAAASSTPALRGLAQVEQDIADTVAESRTLATALNQCEDAAKSALLDRQLERLAKREEQLRDEKAQLRDELKRKELALERDVASQAAGVQGDGACTFKPHSRDQHCMGCSAARLAVAHACSMSLGVLSAARVSVSVATLVEWLRSDSAPLPGRAVLPAGASPAAVPCPLTDELSLPLESLSLSPPSGMEGARGRPSLTRHEAALQAGRRISSTLFGAHLKFVNRQAQCNELVRALAANHALYLQQRAQPAPEYSKQVKVVFSAGAPGIGKTTWARLALDHYQAPEDGGPQLEASFADALAECKRRGWRYRLSYADGESTIEQEKLNAPLSIAARWLWEHIKYECEASTSARVRSFEALWTLLAQRGWDFAPSDVLRYICGVGRRDAMCLLNLDEVNVLFPDGPRGVHSPRANAFLSATLSALLSLQKAGEGFVVPVLTATKALQLEGAVVASGVQYWPIPLPLLAPSYVEEMALDLRKRCADALGEPSEPSEADSGPASDLSTAPPSNSASMARIPPVLRHLLALMAGNPRFLELLLFRLGRPDGAQEEWEPSQFLRTWQGLHAARAGSADLELWLRAVLRTALSRYATFDTYLQSAECAAIVPELLFYSLFELPIARTDSIGGCAIEQLEQNGVIFLSPRARPGDAAAALPSDGAAVAGAGPLRLILPFLWLHRVVESHSLQCSNFMRVPLLRSIECCLSPATYEELMLAVLALRCYFYAKQATASQRVVVSTEQLLGVPPVAGSPLHIRLPAFAETCWRLIKLRHLVTEQSWQDFADAPSNYMEDAPALTSEAAQGRRPIFCLNAEKASFFDAVALLEPPVFLQAKRSQVSLEAQAAEQSPTSLSWPRVRAEALKCAVPQLQPIFLLCADQTIARPPTRSAAAVSTRHAATSDASEQSLHRRMFLVDSSNERDFFGSLLVTRKAMCFSELPIAASPSSL